MADLKLDHKFDAQKKRHYLNDQLTVLHCHHYSTLFTQLALDARELVDGTLILKDTAEDIFYEVLSGYYKKHGVSDPEERKGIASEMFSALGFGKLSILSGDASGGEVDMPVSHVDDGWLKKWGKASTPVNYIGAGYVAAMFAAAFDKPPRTFKVTETESRAMGAGKSNFKVAV